MNFRKIYSVLTRREFLARFLFLFFSFISLFSFTHKRRRKKRYVKVFSANIKEGITIISPEWAIYKDKNNIFAINLHCKHLGCLVNWIEEKEVFLCPCHKSKYDKMGNVIRGPAKESLTRKKVIKKGEEYLIPLSEWAYRKDAYFTEEA